MGCRLGARGGRIAQVRRPATAAGAAAMSISSIPGRRWRRHCADRSAAIAAIRRVSNLAVTDIVTRTAQVVGAVALDLAAGEPVTIAAKAVIIAAGGLTRSIGATARRPIWAAKPMRWPCGPAPNWSTWSSCSSFPSGIWRRAWSAWTRSCGIRSATSSAADSSTEGRRVHRPLRQHGRRPYDATRDIATYAIVKEVEAGRGSPHGGVYLIFRHVAEAALRARSVR